MTQRTNGNASRGFPGAGTLKDVAGVGKIVLNGSGEVGVAGAQVTFHAGLWSAGSPPSTGRDSVQFFQSALAIIMATGERR